MLIITHRLKTSSDFMDRFLPDGSAGGFFLPQKLGMPLGSEICLELHLVWLDEVHFAYAHVERTEVQWDNCGKVEKGCIVRLHPQERKLRRELIEKVRLSAEATRDRPENRVPVAMQVHYFDAKRKPRPGQVLDVSPTGAYVRTPRPLPAGSDVHLRFQDKKRNVMRHIRGKVVRLDFSRKIAGMGVEFQFASRSERRMMRKLCAHLDAAATA